MGERLWYNSKQSPHIHQPCQNIGIFQRWLKMLISLWENVYDIILNSLHIFTISVLESFIDD